MGLGLSLVGDLEVVFFVVHAEQGAGFAKLTPGLGESVLDRLQVRFGIGVLEHDFACQTCGLHFTKKIFHPGLDGRCFLGGFSLEAAGGGSNLGDAQFERVDFSEQVVLARLDVGGLLNSMKRTTTTMTAMMA